MTLVITVPKDVEARLASQAQKAGQDLATYAAGVLQVAASRSSVEDLLRPVRESFARSGLTEDEVIDAYEVEKHALRAAQRGKDFDE